MAAPRPATGLLVATDQSAFSPSTRPRRRGPGGTLSTLGSTSALLPPPHRAPMRFCGRPRALQDQHASARRAWNTHLLALEIEKGARRTASDRKQAAEPPTSPSFLSAAAGQPCQPRLRLPTAPTARRSSSARCIWFPRFELVVGFGHCPSTVRFGAVARTRPFSGCA